jgi:hypothetical protein
MCAEFAIADEISRGNEGAWQGDPADRGNAANGYGTYRGVASKFHPTWKGWPIIAAETAKLPPQPKYNTKAYYVWVKRLNAALEAITELQEMVVAFYRVNFWDVNRLGELKSQGAANHCYDHGINRGTGTAAILLQKTIGVLADGRIGPVTLAAANKLPDNELAALYRKARRLDYLRIIKANPALAQYQEVWLARC